MTEPIDEKYLEAMNRLANMLDQYFNADMKPGDNGTVFLLLVGEVNNMGGGRVNYISNGQSDDMLALMREYLARAEGRYSEPEQESKQ